VTPLPFWSRWALVLGVLAHGCARPVPARKPQVAVLPSRLDLGVLTQDESAQGTVELSSLGASVARLGTVASSARCRWLALPGELAPGARVRLSVLCQSDLLGPLEEQLTLLDASRGEGLAALSIVGRVEPIVGFATAFVDLRPAWGQVESRDVPLVGKRAREVRPKVTTTGGDIVSATPVAAAAGGMPGLRISCRADRVGMHAGSLVMATGIAEHPKLICTQQQDLCSGSHFAARDQRSGVRRS